MWQQFQSLDGRVPFNPSFSEDTSASFHFVSFPGASSCIFLANHGRKWLHVSALFKSTDSAGFTTNPNIKGRYGLKALAQCVQCSSAARQGGNWSGDDCTHNNTQANIYSGITFIKYNIKCSRMTNELLKTGRNRNNRHSSTIFQQQCVCNRMKAKLLLSL